MPSRCLPTLASRQHFALPSRSMCPRLAIALLVAAALLGCAAPRPEGPVAVKILAINDFHGNLLPPRGGIRIRDPHDPAKTVSVAAGGAEYLASAVAELRAKNPNHVFV